MHADRISVLLFVHVVFIENMLRGVLSKSLLLYKLFGTIKHQACIFKTELDLERLYLTRY